MHNLEQYCNESFFCKKGPNDGWIDKVNIVKFFYSEKATNFCKISTVNLSYVVKITSTMEISQNFVTISEFMNFTKLVVSSTEQKRAWQAYELSHAPRHSLMYRMHSYDL